MTTSDMIETFVSVGMKAFKKLYKDTAEGRKLDRHEAVVVNGNEFTYWREYTVYKMGEYIRDILPEADIIVELEGNDSTIRIENVSDDDVQKLNRMMYLFLEKNGCL